MTVGDDRRGDKSRDGKEFMHFKNKELGRQNEGKMFFGESNSNKLKVFAVLRKQKKTTITFKLKLSYLRLLYLFFNPRFLERLCTNDVKETASLFSKMPSTERCCSWSTQRGCERVSRTVCFSWTL